MTGKYFISVFPKVSDPMLALWEIYKFLISVLQNE